MKLEEKLFCSWSFPLLSFFLYFDTEGGEGKGLGFETTILLRNQLTSYYATGQFQEEQFHVYTYYKLTNPGFCFRF